ncbi:MAG: dephospho-CoA kinase [Burkholderiales bacterium]|nr:dephospho-CoA kinase [Burkholderiales bacterium]
MSLLIGLTGGIGSGKSTAAASFAELGAFVVDTDALAHELTHAGGAAIPVIAEAFGPDYVDAQGVLDRVAMRQLIFSDQAAKRRLEALLHPLIRRLADQRLAASAAPYCLLVAPLLIETGHYRQRVDRILVVDCSEEAQLNRAMARSGLDEQTVRAIMTTQVDRATRLAAADDVLDNSGDFAALSLQVHALHVQYLARAASKEANRS